MGLIVFAALLFSLMLGVSKWHRPQVRDHAPNVISVIVLAAVFWVLMRCFPMF